MGLGPALWSIVCDFFALLASPFVWFFGTLWEGLVLAYERGGWDFFWQIVFVLFAIGTCVVIPMMFCAHRLRGESGNARAANRDGVKEKERFATSKKKDKQAVI